MSLRRRGPEARRAALVFAAIAAGVGLTCLAASARAEGPERWWTPEHAELFGRVELEATGFFQDAQFPGQRRDGLSVSGEATALLEWNGGDTVFTATPFLRLDGADDTRSHADLRDLKIEHIAGDWAVTFGVDREFWGKVEVVHLVDIVNQTDQVEDLDDEDRLGQPLVKVSRLTDLGELSLYYFPYARMRTLPGREGRLRPELPFVTDRAEFEPRLDQWAPSGAARFTGFAGDVDYAISLFHGVSRDPAFRAVSGSGGTRLLPVYSRITQLGLEGQYTSGATLWKAEAILREGQRDAAFEQQSYVAVTGGLEHTLFQVAGSAADLGLILEGAYDSRGSRALTAFDNDVIGGLRLTLNDTQDTSLLLTGSVDVETAAMTFRLEAERRLSATVTASLEAQGFVNSGEDLFSRGIADDSFVRLKIAYFF